MKLATYQEWVSCHVFTRQRQAVGYVAIHESVPASQYDAHLYSRYVDLPAETQAAIDRQFAYRFRGGERSRENGGNL